MKSAYEQILIYEKDRCKTVFLCHHGFNMPSIFSANNGNALSPMVGKLDEPTSVYIFVNGILVSSVDMGNQMRDLQKLLDLLSQPNLKLNSSKCSL